MINLIYDITITLYFASVLFFVAGLFSPRIGNIIVRTYRRSLGERDNA